MQGFGLYTVFGHVLYTGTSEAPAGASATRGHGASSPRLAMNGTSSWSCILPRRFWKFAAKRGNRKTDDDDPIVVGATGAVPLSK